jgi:hypothetical protein
VPDSASQGGQSRYNGMTLPVGPLQGEFKWQMANGKIQMVFHLPFALCHLPFEIALTLAHRAGG